MKIIFCSGMGGQTGTTSNLAIISAYFSLKLSCRVFLMQSQYESNYLDEAFLMKQEEDPRGQENGIDTLIRMIKSEPITKEMIDSCSVNLYHNRLFLLPKTSQQDASMYETIIIPILVYCLNAVNQYYELLLLDAGRVDKEQTNPLLQSADIVVVNLCQNEHFLKAYFTDSFLYQRNIFYLIGNYDPVSKYNLPYLCKKYKIPAARVGVIPQNTMFRDAYSDGTIVKFLSQIMNSTKDEMNFYFLNEVDKTARKLLSFARKENERNDKMTSTGKRQDDRREKQ